MATLPEGLDQLSISFSEGGGFFGGVATVMMSAHDEHRHRTLQLNEIAVSNAWDDALDRHVETRSGLSYSVFDDGHNRQVRIDIAGTRVYIAGAFELETLVECAVSLERTHPLVGESVRFRIKT